MRLLTENDFIERTAFHIKIIIPLGQNDQDTINQILQNQKLRELTEKSVYDKQISKKPFVSFEVWEFLKDLLDRSKI